jgi:hypothetical protein
MIVASGEHGMFFAGECKSRHGIPIIQLPEDTNGENLDQLIRQKMFKPGALKVDVSGELRPRGLAVTKIHEFHFEEMNEAEDKGFWAAIGLAGL